MVAIANTPQDIAGLAREPDRDVTSAAILEAGARCLGRWGIAKTTVEDVAREAGVSRATVYRYFPGGRDHLVLGVGIYEEGRFTSHLAPILDRFTSLDETLVTVVHEASSHLAGHALVGTLVRHEPHLILPLLAFDRIGPLLYRTTAFLEPYLERYLPAEEIAHTAEWVTRMVISYWLQPSDHIDPTTRQGAERLVRRYLLPALEPASTEPASTEPASTEPASTEPASTEPASTEPASTEPASTEPASTEPARSTGDDHPGSDQPDGDPDRAQ